jgi:hypothetical protein
VPADFPRSGSKKISFKDKPESTSVKIEFQPVLRFRNSSGELFREELAE